jgi:HK97 family phage major capsid protein
MTLAERIQAAQAALLAKKDSLVALTNKMLETPDDDSVITQVDAVSAEIELDTKSLESLQRAEAALASRSAPAIVTAKHLGSHEDAKNYIYREAAVKLLAVQTNKSIEQVMSERYSKDETFKDFLVAKSVQNPAQTNVPGYVQELINPIAMQGFLADLRPASVVARLPFFSVTFGSNNWAGAKFLYRDRSRKAAAAYRAEGAPSVVRGALFTSRVLPPYLLSVITTATKEALRYSNPDLEAILRSAMISDTGESLDVSVLSNAPAVAGVSPAGLLNGIVPMVSSGQDLDQISNDVRLMKTTFINANVGTGLHWIISDATVLFLQTVTNALGAYVYKDELATGRWEGLPYVSSTNVDSDQIILVATQEIAFAMSSPEVSMSMEATLHEESETPAQVGGSTAPVRSLFQTNSWAIKTDSIQSHMRLRDPSVAVLDISAWV